MAGQVLAVIWLLLHYQNFGLKLNIAELRLTCHGFGKGTSGIKESLKTTSPYSEFGLLCMIILIRVESQTICAGKHDSITFLETSMNHVDSKSLPITLQTN